MWAELGRSRMPLGTALGLPVGAVVDLDRPAEAPVDLYVNGMRFARGQLLVTEDGEWAVSLECARDRGAARCWIWPRPAQARREDSRPAVEPEGDLNLPTESDHPTEDPDATPTPDPETPEVMNPKWKEP